ncbi:hypothetical protein EIN_248140 [Entamoeba invadens IP1]|uniref:Laminin G domain-containing protein n=1 Tax=Entamoeba invadens IP1 TaxID=370355 RepID=A0A0A1UE27_ENTIV|nr:hypothetical protein EIN_248140 [Entamoeba invadens IP1]ELP94850.1 hypothetical protein EIN_248140 [Entamoeba invadens IP1]|eukprot:XP_004261621.1 hypothetical protein EIN_248140 [Entamoeba invadens IP1]
MTSEEVLQWTIPLLCNRSYDSHIPLDSCVYQFREDIEEVVYQEKRRIEVYQTMSELTKSNMDNVSKLSDLFVDEIIKEIITFKGDELKTGLGLLCILLKTRQTHVNFLELIRLYLVETDQQNSKNILSVLNSAAHVGGPERYYAFPGLLTCLYSDVTVGKSDTWGVALSFLSQGDGVVFSVRTPSSKIVLQVESGQLTVVCGNDENNVNKKKENSRTKMKENKWHTITLLCSKRGHRVTVDYDKENMVFQMNYPQNEKGVFSIGGIPGDAESYFKGYVTDVTLLPSETVIQYFPEIGKVNGGATAIESEREGKGKIGFVCYQISQFSPIQVVERETTGSIIRRTGGIGGIVSMLDYKRNKRSFEDSNAILELLYVVLTVFPVLRKDAIESEDITKIFMGLIELAKESKVPHLEESVKPKHPVAHEFIEFGLKMVSTNIFTPIRNLVLRHLFNIEWWESDKLKLEFTKELTKTVTVEVIDELPFKLFEKVSYRNLLSWYLGGEIPELVEENVPKVHYQWRCGYIQYVSTIVVTDFIVVQYYVTDILKLLDKSIKEQNHKDTGLLLYTFLCFVLFSKYQIKDYVKLMLLKNKAMLLELYMTPNPSFVKNSVQRILALLKIQVNFDTIETALGTTRLTPLLYQICIETTYNNVRNTYCDTTKSGYLSSESFISSMDKKKVGDDYITPFLKALSQSITKNFSRNKVVLDIVLNDLILCKEDHCVWQCLIQSKEWLFVFVDIAVGLVTQKEAEMLSRFETIFARVIGVSFTRTKVTLESVVCHILCRLKNKQHFFNIFRGVMRNLCFDIVPNIDEKSQEVMVQQMIFLFSEFFCYMSSFGFDEHLPHFKEDYELVKRCLGFHYPQPKSCTSVVSQMQHIFTVNLIFCQLNAICLVQDVELLRKTLQLIPPYLVHRPGFEGYDSWVISHLYDITQSCSDANVRRDIGNMMYLLNQQRQVPNVLDTKGIKRFGDQLTAFYKKQEDGLKEQTAVLKEQVNRNKDVIKVVFKDVYYPNLG